MDFLKNVLYGMIIGLANIIPGVSGGTMAVVLNVFDRLISSISNIRKSFKKNAIFLLGIGIGAGLAILLFSKGISFLLDNHYMVTNFFFVGVILGSIPLVYKKATFDIFKPQHIIWGVITLILMLITVYVVPSADSQNIVTVLTLFQFVKLFIITAISAICMIIPGISGSFVMLLFGTYETVTVAISDLNLLILLPVALGAATGILVGSKIIDGLLKRYPQATYFSILGFMIGSIPAIVDKIAGENAFIGGMPLVIGVVVLIVGAAISYAFSNENLKEKIIAKRKSNGGQKV